MRYSWDLLQLEQQGGALCLLPLSSKNQLIFSVFLEKMSDYKKYKRINEQLNEIVDEELSCNNSSSSGSDTARPLVDENPLSSHSNKKDLDEVLDLDGTVENDSTESGGDVEEHYDLLEKLAKWAVENNCT